MLQPTHRDVVRALVTIDDVIYSAGRDKTLRQWDGAPQADGSPGYVCSRTLAAHTDDVLALSFERRGAWPRRAPTQLGGSLGLLFSASRAGEVRIWDRESMVCLDAWVAHASAIHSMVRRTSGSNRRIWSVAACPRRAVFGPRGRLTRIDVLPLQLVRDDCLITASGDGTIKVHRALQKSGAPPQTV